MTNTTQDRTAEGSPERLVRRCFSCKGNLVPEQEPINFGMWRCEECGYTVIFGGCRASKCDPLSRRRIAKSGGLVRYTPKHGFCPPNVSDDRQLPAASHCSQFMILILGKIENTGLRKTGRWIRPDGVNYVEETESCPEPKAMVWSSDPEKFEDGEKWAKENGWTTFRVEDTENAIQRVRYILANTEMSQRAESAERKRV